VIVPAAGFGVLATAAARALTTVLRALPDDPRRGGQPTPA
jgi:hypothetical protein